MMLSSISILLLILILRLIDSEKTRSKNPTRLEALRQYDSVLQDYLLITNNSLPDIVALSALYFLREDQFKQGGEVESLQYTERALRDLEHLCSSNTQFNISTNVVVGSSCDYDEIHQSLLEALRIHQIRMLVLVGRYEDAIAAANFSLVNHIERFGQGVIEDSIMLQRAFNLPPILTRNIFINNTSHSEKISGTSSFFLLKVNASTMVDLNFTKIQRVREQRARLYNSFGEVYLSQGDSMTAIPHFAQTIDLAPCMHHAYFQLARALQSSKSAIVTTNSLSETSPVWDLASFEKIVKRLQCRSESLLGGVTVVRREIAENLMNNEAVDEIDSVDDEEGDNENRESNESSTVSYKERTDIVYRPNPIGSNNLWDGLGDEDYCEISSILAAPMTDVEDVSSTSCIFGDELVYLEELLRFGNLGPWQYAAQASSLVIRSALYWTLFHTAEIMNDYKLAWFYLQQGRSLERKRIYQVTQLKQQQQHYEKQQRSPDTAAAESASTIPFVPPSESNFWVDYRSQSQQIAVQLTRLYPSHFWPPHSPISSSSTTASDKSEQSTNRLDEIVPIESLDNFAASTSSSNETKGNRTVRPIFIVGFFRSGSTLLESLLESHPNIVALGERSPFAQSVATSLQPLARQHLTLLRSQQQQQQMPQKSSSSGASKDTGDKKRSTSQDKLWQMEKQLIESQLQVSREDIVQQMMHWVNTLYPNQTMSFSSSNNTAENGTVVSRIVDKMLTNYRHVGLIHWLFPRAIILHTIRDPIDTLVSCLRHRFADDASAYTLDMESLVEEYLAYTMVMQHFRRLLPWREYPLDNRSEKNESQEESQSSKVRHRIVHQPVIDIRYEMLIAHPELVLEDVWRLLDVSPPTNNTENLVATFHQRTMHRSVRTASFLQVKQPISSKNVGQWRNYAPALIPTLLRIFDEKLSVLRQHHGLLPYFTANTSKFKSSSSKLDMNWALDVDFDYAAQLQAMYEYVEQQQGIISSTTTSTAIPKSSSSKKSRKAKK